MGYMQSCSLIGCWFGNPRSSEHDLRVWIANVAESDLRPLDCQLRSRDLCRKLTELLFSEEELTQGSATEARTTGVKLLDAHKLYVIRGIVMFYVFTCTCNCISYL